MSMDKIEIQISADGEYIYAPLKRKWLKNTPEEEVRQEFICLLVNDYGFSLEQMEQEVTTTESSQRGTGKARADIVIWAKSTDKYNRKRALIVVECKATNVSITPKTYYQGFNYASWMHAKFLVLTNQKDTKFFELNEKIVPQSFVDLEVIIDIPNAQQARKYSGKVFSNPVPIGLLPRDKEADSLFDEVIINRFFNLIGVGGSGKSSLAYLMIQKHESDFNEIAYVVVNNNIKDDFVEQINKTLKLEFEKDEDPFSEIIVHLQKTCKSELPNLLVLDINETSDKEKNDEIINSLLKNKDILNGWKILILSRENVDTRNRITTHNLNEKEDVDFLKQLFLSKAGTRYNDFGDFDELFKTIFYNPLLAEQLGLYLNAEPELATIDDIKKILYGESFREEDMQGLSADRHDEPIVSFLTNLIKYNDLNLNEKNLLRHFVLWQAEYIGYEVIKDLLKGVFASDDDLKNTLKSLSKRSILATNNDKTLSYKLHGLLAESLHQQINVKNENYDFYLNNIDRIIEYDYDIFSSYVDCIGNSLCEYDITHIRIYFETAVKFHKMWKIDYSYKLYAKCIKSITETQNSHNNSDLATVYNNIALLQANSYDDYQAAVDNFYKAIEIREQLPKDNSKYQNELAESYKTLANVLSDNLNDFESAKAYYIKAISIRKQLPKDKPKYQNDLASVYNNLATLLKNDYFHDYQSAKEYYTEAITIREQLHTDVLEYQNGLASSYNNLAILLQDKFSCYKLAKDNYAKAIVIWKRISNKNIIFKNDLASAYNNLAILEQNFFHNYESAKTYFVYSIEIRGQLPNFNPEIQNGLASAYNNLALLQTDYLFDYEAALDNYNIAIEIRKQLPKFANYQNQLATTFYNLARLQQSKLHQYQSAQANYYNAIQIGQSLPKDNFEYMYNLSSSLYNLAILQSDQFKDYELAKHNYLKVIEIRELLPTSNILYQKNLAWAYFNLAILLKTHFHNYESAKDNYNKAIKIRELLPKDNSVNLNSLAVSFFNIANLENENLKNYQSAQDYYIKSINIWEQISKDNGVYQNYLASAYNNLASLQRKYLKDYEAANNNFQKAIEIRERLPKDNAEYQHYLALVYNAYAYLCYEYFKNYEVAKENCNKAIEIEKKLSINNPDKYLIEWINCKHSLAEMYFVNNEIDAAKSILDEIKPLAEKSLLAKPKDTRCKSVNKDINDLIAKIQYKTH